MTAHALRLINASAFPPVFTEYVVQVWDVLLYLSMFSGFDVTILRESVVAYVCHLVQCNFVTVGQRMLDGLRPFVLFVCVDALPPNQQLKSCLDDFLSSAITKQLIKRLAQ